MFVETVASFGEPIWVIDPIGFMIISVLTGFVFFLGAIASLGDILPEEEKRRLKLLFG
jgi:hypothetical protein